MILVPRHFGASYSDMHADYSGQGVDQLLDCIRKIKTNPADRWGHIYKTYIHCSIEHGIT